MQNSEERGRADKRTPIELREIATNVTILRARVGLSQAALAARAGLSRGAISDIERVASPDPTFRTLLRIANGLGVSLTELFIPAERGFVDDHELLRRAKADKSEFLDSEALHKAIAERDKPYSKAGRPRAKAS